MIAAYGTEEDRQRLRVIAEASSLSQSAWVISRVREAYRELHGDTPPSEVLSANSTS
jgi:hypothetical protein